MKKISYLSIAICLVVTSINISCSKKEKITVDQQFYDFWATNCRNQILDCCPKFSTIEVNLIDERLAEITSDYYRDKAFNWVLSNNYFKNNDEILVSEVYVGGGHYFVYRMIVEKNGKKFKGVYINMNSSELNEIPYEKLREISINDINNKKDCCEDREKLLYNDSFVIYSELKIIKDKLQITNVKIVIR